MLLDGLPAAGVHCKVLDIARKACVLRSSAWFLLPCWFPLKKSNDLNSVGSSQIPARILKIFPDYFMSDVAWKLDGDTQMNPWLLKLFQLMKI